MLVLIVCLLALMALGASTGSARTGACRLGAHERVVVHAPGGVVVDRHRVVEADPEPEGWTDTYRACLSSRGRWVVLGVSRGFVYEGGSSLFGFQLRGVYVTFVYEDANKYAHVDTKVEQYNLLTGRRDFVANYEAEPFVARLGDGHVQLASSPSGNVAWVLVTLSCESCAAHQNVVAHDRGGTFTLASYPAAAGDVSDLRVDAAAVSWLHLGEPESAPLA